MSDIPMVAQHPAEPPPLRAPFAKRCRAWMRQIHRYLALFISPFLVVFAFSVILLNHARRPDSGTPATTSRRTAAINLLVGLEGMDLAKEIMRQVAVAGEIDYLPNPLSADRFTIPVTRPGRKITLRADRPNKTVTIEERRLSLGETVNYLHKSPGPHNASLRGNWLFTRLWTILADGTVYFLFLVSVTGIYLWTMIHSERRSGWLALGGGAVSFVVILLALTC